MAMSLHINSNPSQALRIALLSAAFCGLALLSVYGQNDSPCNQGRDPLYEPRNPYAICLPEIGRMDNFHGAIIHLAAVGDVDNSGTIDFVADNTSRELLLYKGVNGGFPLSSDGQRIGPTELNSITEFLAAGDWDGDDHPDIAARIQITGDTSAGNVDGYEIARLVVFWGNDSGNYSIQDTTRLESGAQMWLSLFYGLSSDADNDGADDLLVGMLSGFSNGKVVRLPRMMIYKGHAGKRWGQDGIGRMADWRYWNPQPAEFDILTFIDQDRDGAGDIVFIANDGGESAMSVLYGRADGELPDTTDVQTVNIGGKAGAGYSFLTDVTGDLVPEILASSGPSNFVKVYVGFKGQRLLEQFGSGNDPAQPDAEEWWGKPWATLWLPHRINQNWFGNDGRLFDLGDANRDGVGDIFSASWPYIIEYNGGSVMDSLVDALINITPGTEILTLKRLGNINGSGQDIIALTTGDGIRFYAPTRDISSVGVPRRLPEGTGKASVEVQPVAGASALVLNAIPNPSHGKVQFSWHGPALHGSVTITLYDLVGQAVAQFSALAEEGAVQCQMQSLSKGTYVAQFRCGDRTASTAIVIR